MELGNALFQAGRDTEQLQKSLGAMEEERDQVELLLTCLVETSNDSLQNPDRMALPRVHANRGPLPGTLTSQTSACFAVDFSQSRPGWGIDLAERDGIAPVGDHPGMLAGQLTG